MIRLLILALLTINYAYSTTFNVSFKELELNFKVEFIGKRIKELKLLSKSNNKLEKENFLRQQLSLLLFSNINDLKKRYKKIDNFQEINILENNKRKIFVILKKPLGTHKIQIIKNKFSWPIKIIKEEYEGIIARKVITKVSYQKINKIYYPLKIISIIGQSAKSSNYKYLVTSEQVETISFKKI